MSSQFLRLLVVSLTLPVASVAFAQKDRVEKRASRTESGNTAFVEEPGFTRFRVVTDQGVLIVYDADEEWDGRDEPISQLAYWHDFATEQLFFFDQLLFSETNVLESIAAIARDLDVTPELLIAEMPDLDPLPVFPSNGAWRAAIEADVLAVMSGVSLADDEGSVSGLASPCVPGGCNPAATAISSGSLSAPIRGTSGIQLFASAQSGSICNCGGGGTPPDPPDPFRNIHPIADGLIAMEDDLHTNHFDPSISPFTEVTGEVLGSFSGGTYVESATIRLQRNGQELRTGSASVTSVDGGNSVALQIVTTFDDGIVGADPQWTLNQTIEFEGNELTFSGSVSVVEAGGNSYSVPGGWTYSALAGPVIDPSSDSEFEQALLNMSAIDDSAVAGGPGASLALYLSVPANVSSMFLNYQRNRRLTYRIPTICDGPTYQEVGGHSCVGVNIPNSDILNEVALKINNLTDVGPAFKKCMMGRLGCRKPGFTLSYHPKVNVRCDDYGSCGPCFYDDGAEGCNLGGRDLWYCPNLFTPCYLAMIIFHEASHACGAQDLQNGAPLDSYRIGYWFQAQCEALP